MVIARYVAFTLEGLWLIAAIAIPLAAVSPGVVLSHMEVPKVAVFRGLVAALAIVWLVEWMVLNPRLFPRVRGFNLGGLVSWLNERLTRWVLLSLWLFLAVNVLSTLTSLSPEVSFWGKRPGGDGYGLYNVLSYAVLFAVVVTHLKQRVQLWRLMAAIVVAGSLVGAISILQHFGLDPIWTRGNPQARALATLGNPIFAGAFLLMTSVITMAAGVALLTRRDALVRIAAPATGILLAIQLVGIAYTFSRGPWIGLAVAIAAFLGLSWTSIRSRRLRNTTALAAVVSVIVVVAVFSGISSLASDSPVSDPDSQTVVQRALSIYPEIAAGGISARTRIWDASLDLVLQRPWHDVTDDPAPWARHPLGYGPETFRYAYPLGSPNGATASFPFEAHNVPLHAAVELGILGLLTLIAVFVTATVAGVRRLLGANNSTSLAERVLLAGLLAMLVGRAVEMMGGIPKVGDLAILMLLLALLVSLIRILEQGRSEPEPMYGHQEVDETQASVFGKWAGLAGRAILVFVAVVSLGVLTWLKSVNYVTADALAADAIVLAQQGERQEGIRLLLKASTRAPDVLTYYLEIARMFDELTGSFQSGDAQSRAALGSRFYSRAAVRANELDPGARAAQANASITLGLQGDPNGFDEAVELSEDVVAMMPNFAVSHYALALPHLLRGDAEQGLKHLEAGDALFDEGENRIIAADSAFLKGIAQRLQGELEAAVGSFNLSLRLQPDGRYASTAHRHLVTLYDSLDDPDAAARHRELAR